MKAILKLTLILTIFGMYSCAETQQVLETTGRVQLDGTYTITSLNGEPVNGMTINFSGITKRVSGNGGCNQYFADYTLNNLTLSIGDIGATKKACPDLDNENELFQALANVGSYNSVGKSLTLYSKDTNDVLIQATEN
jgi:heat shock protein HslJ